jgi:hypothetical protein
LINSLRLAALAGSTMQQNGMGMQPLLHHPPPHSTDDTHSGIHLLLLMLLLDNIHENSFLFMYKVFLKYGLYNIKFIYTDNRFSSFLKKFDIHNFILMGEWSMLNIY